MNATVMPLIPPAPAPTPGECTAIVELGHHPSDTQLEAFWNGPGTQSPIIEAAHPGHSHVTFIWRGNEPTVYVSLNRVTSTLEHAALHQLPGTDLWHRTYILPNDWRTSYTMLAPTPQQHTQLRAATPRWAMRLIRENGHPDPRNPQQLRAHAGTMSEVALAQAHRCELLNPLHTSAEAHANVHTTELVTPTGHQAWLIETPDYETPYSDDTLDTVGDLSSELENFEHDADRPLIIMLDGHIWHTTGAIPRLLSALHSHGHPTPAVLLIATTPEQRTTEYGADSTFPDTIVDTILPWIRRIAPISHNPNHITLCGESLGGLTALRTALTHPQHVRNIIAQSSSLWATDLQPQVPPITATTPPLNIALTVGSYEAPMLTQHHQLHATLTEAGHHSTLTEYTGGHDMAWWVQLWGAYVLKSHTGS